MQLFVVYANQYQISEDGCDSTKKFCGILIIFGLSIIILYGMNWFFMIAFFEILEIAIARSLTYWTGGWYSTNLYVFDT